MLITLVPVRADETLTLDRQGDTLIINGAPVDIAALADIDTEEAAPNRFLVGPVTRQGADYAVSILYPYGEDRRGAPPQARELRVTEDGPVDLGG